MANKNGKAVTRDADGRLQKGSVLNPAGRPKDVRPMATLLRIAGDEEIEIGGQVMTRSQFAANAMWSLITTGKAQLLNGTVIKVGTYADWLDTYKHVSKHVDGPTRNELNALIGVNVKAYINFSPDEWNEESEPITIDERK